MPTSRRRFLTALASPAVALFGAAPRLTVERVEFIPVTVPMKKGTAVSENYGKYLDVRLRDFDKYQHYLLKLYAGGGIVALGETGREVPEAGVKANADFLQGKDLRQLDFSKPSLGLPDARTADGFEIAIYDAMGKALGVPVHTLLGGGMQQKVAVSYWTGQRTEADLIEIGQRALTGGFHNLKFKARFGDPIDKQLGAVAKACPGLTFVVDFNSSYPDLAAFLPVAKRLEGFPVTIEDPVPKRLDWFRQLRQRTTIPYALTPSGPEQLFEAIRQEACDVFNLGGDMRTFVKLGYAAQLAGIPAWHGSGVEMGVRDASFIHAAAATRSCTMGSDTLSYLREHTLLTGNAMQPRDGFIDVPQGPGLGVELDEDAVKRYGAGARR